MHLQALGQQIDGDVVPGLLSDGQRALVAYTNPDTMAIAVHPAFGTDNPFNIGFGANPDAEQSVSIASVIDILNSGATLVLQANNDILLPLGLDIVANQGTLRLEAGRSIDIKGNLDRTNAKDACQPALRVGRLRELGWAATFLASPYARFISGHTLVVDGANWQRRSLTNPAVVTVRDQMGKGPFEPGDRP